MRSIDNLREYALTAASVNATTRAVLAGYIDEIEREVEELRDRDYRNGREDAKGAVEFADRLKAAVDNREDVTLWCADYTPLPVDADGVPIHVGDVMDNTHKDGFRAKSVIGMCLHSSGQWTVEVDEDRLRWHDVYKLRHYHAPTVEDVLREFADAWVEWKDGAAMMNPVETFAARLRLAGDE